MALKKSQLYSSLWSSCDELRGSMDASQYKDYVLVLLFVKYVSDKYAGKRDAMIEVPAGGGFSDMVALKGDKAIGEKMNKIIAKLAEANDLKGVIDQADFDDPDRLGQGREMQDRISRLVGIFESLDFRANRAAGDDLLGDAYEYLMRHFATDSGKSKGQFYTPAEVSRILAKIVGIGPNTRPDQTIYDPTCGSGSLLLKAADEAPQGMSIYGQENDLATWAMARMNMILHGHPTAELWKGNTLAAPYFKNPDGTLRTFDFAVANPPFSTKAWSTGFDPANDEFKRFEYGVPPPKNGDYAFLLHVVRSLKSTGRAAVILPHGVLFRGNKEADIRRNLIQRGLIKGIIGLPANLFYGTSIPACIVIIDKESAPARTGIFMVDASGGFIKDGNKNRLRSQDLHKVVDVFNKQIELVGYSRLVRVAEIASAANSYNLNLSRYIPSAEMEDLHDLDAHMRGGIPNRDVDALQPYWTVLPSLRERLFEAGDRPGFSRPKVAAADVTSTVVPHPEFQAYAANVLGIIEQWKSTFEPTLVNFAIGSKPKVIIHALSEDLLERCSAVPLLDEYKVYQRLMDYWDEVMQDDLYLIATEGWLDAARPRPVIEDDFRKIKESPDLTVKAKKFKTDLVPPNLLAARFFAEEERNIGALEAAHVLADNDLADYVEEHGGEDGLLADAKNEKGTVTRSSVIQRMKTLESEPESDEERQVVARCLVLVEAEAAARKAVGEARTSLDAKLLACYGRLTETDVKALVVPKWWAAICAVVQAEVERLSESLSNRVQELEERYAEPLPSLARESEALAARVNDHLRRMGVEWS